MAGSASPSFIRGLPWLKALAAAALCTLLLGYLSARSPLFNSFEYWTSDWRTALFADRHDAQHSSLAVVIINDETLAGLPYRSPIDRGLLSDIIKTVDNAGARVIALDFIFDQPTEPAKDAALAETLKTTNARVVLGTLDERTGLDEERLAYNRRFVADAGARSGLLTMRTELDGTVRSLPQPVAGAPLYFGVAAAEAAGAISREGASRRIAWLRHPPQEDAFLRIPAHQLLSQPGDAGGALRTRLLSTLKGRTVLIGAQLSDGNDIFFTPLSKLDNQPMPGVLIHAHIAAQVLDGRGYWEFGREGTLILVALTALLGFLLGWRYFRSSVLVGLPPILAYLAADIVAFSVFDIILPFALPALAWVLGVFAGRATRWLSEQDKRTGIQTEEGT